MSDIKSFSIFLWEGGQAYMRTSPHFLCLLHDSLPNGIYGVYITKPWSRFIATNLQITLFNIRLSDIISSHPWPLSTTLLWSNMIIWFLLSCRGVSWAFLFNVLLLYFCWFLILYLDLDQVEQPILPDKKVWMIAQSEKDNLQRKEDNTCAMHVEVKT